MLCAGAGVAAVRLARACPDVAALSAPAGVDAVALNTIPGSAGSTALAIRTRNAGSATVSNGSATNAAAAAVHTVWRAAAERPRRR